MNVVQLPVLYTTHSKDQDYVYEHIMRFLKGKARSSENTAKKFKRDIEMFFKVVRGKELHELTKNDLKVTNSEVVDYQEYLSKNYKNSIVNNAFTAVRSLYKYLKRNDFDVNPDAVIVDRLPDDTLSTGYLHHDEVMKLAELALEEKHDPIMKKAIIEVAYGTSLRINALLKIRYRDLRGDEIDPNKYWIEPRDVDEEGHITKDKSKMIKKVIHAEAIEPMLRLKKAYGYSDDDYVFQISPRALNDMIKRLVKKAGLDPKRGITFHSLRKAGAMSASKLSNGNPFVVSKQGNWENLETVNRHYIQSQENIMGMAAFENFEEDIYEQLTKEQLIELLNSLNGDILEIKLKREARKMIAESRKREC
jgi:integrase/recombinase XerD